VGALSLAKFRSKTMSSEVELNNRRQMLAGAAAMAICADDLLAAPPAPSTIVPATETRRDLTKADIDDWMRKLSNWGRWGKDDQPGTINLITPAERHRREFMFSVAPLRVSGGTGSPFNPIATY
jgi:hypothetical protein